MQHAELARILPSTVTSASSATLQGSARPDLVDEAKPLQDSTAFA
jgi:hypothetical protein